MRRWADWGGALGCATIWECFLGACGAPAAAAAAAVAAALFSVGLGEVMIRAEFSSWATIWEVRLLVSVEAAVRVEALSAEPNMRNQETSDVPCRDVPLGGFEKYSTVGGVDAGVDGDVVVGDGEGNTFRAKTDSKVAPCFSWRWLDGTFCCGCVCGEGGDVGDGGEVVDNNASAPCKMPCTGENDGLLPPSH